MITIKIDENQINEMCREEIIKRINELDVEFVFWDAKELMRRTCMSWNFIQQQFFYDERFPKKKISSKWYFPAKETREFLIRWLKEQ